MDSSKDLANDASNKDTVRKNNCKTVDLTVKIETVDLVSDDSCEDNMKMEDSEKIKSEYGDDKVSFDSALESSISKDKKPTVLNSNSESYKNLKRKRSSSLSSGSNSCTVKLYCESGDNQHLDSSLPDTESEESHFKLYSLKKNKHQKSQMSFSNSCENENVPCAYVSNSSSSSEHSNSVVVTSKLPVLVINNLNLGIQSTKNDEEKQTGDMSLKQASVSAPVNQKIKRSFLKSDDTLNNTNDSPRKYRKYLKNKLCNTYSECNINRCSKNIPERNVIKHVSPGKNISEKSKEIKNEIETNNILNSVENVPLIHKVDDDKLSDIMKEIKCDTNSKKTNTTGEIEEIILDSDTEEIKRDSDIEEIERDSSDFITTPEFSKTEACVKVPEFANEDPFERNNFTSKISIPESFEKSVACDVTINESTLEFGNYHSSSTVKYQDICTVIELKNILETVNSSGAAKVTACKENMENRITNDSEKNMTFSTNEQSCLTNYNIDSKALNNSSSSAITNLDKTELQQILITVNKLNSAEDLHVNDKIFEDNGTQSYLDTGISSKQYVEMGEKFEKALVKNDLLVETGIENSDVECNVREPAYCDTDNNSNKINDLGCKKDVVINTEKMDSITKKVENDITLYINDKDIESQESKDNEKKAIGEIFKKGISPKENNSRKEINDDLFMPEETPSSETAEARKLAEQKKSERFCGNRVSNRGTFLTESSSTKIPRTIKILKKKVSKNNNKFLIDYPDKLHALTETPDINIDLSKNHSHRIKNKYIESSMNYKSYDVTLHCANSNALMKDESSDVLNSHIQSSTEENFANENTPSLKDPTPVSSSSLINNNMLVEGPLLNTSADFMSNTTTHLNSSLASDNQYFMNQFPYSGLPSINPSQPPFNCSKSYKDSRIQSTSSEFKNRFVSAPEIENNTLSNFRNLNYSAPTNTPILNQFPCSTLSSNIQSQLPFNFFYSYMDPRIQTASSMLNIRSDSDPLSNFDGLNYTARNIPCFLPTNHSSQLTFNSFQPCMNLGIQAANSMFNNRSDSAFQMENTTLSNFGNLNYAMSTNIPCPSNTSLMVQPQLNGSLMPSVVNDVLSESICKQNESREIQQVFGEKGNINTSLNSHNLNSVSSAVPASWKTGVTQKIPCLLPDNVKYMIGDRVIENTDNVLFLILEWNVDWLTQQKDNQDPPIIPPNKLRTVIDSYKHFEDYYNTFFPLLMLETWHRIYQAWTDLNQRPSLLGKIESYLSKDCHLVVKCKAVFNADPDAKMVYPDVGKIIIVNYSTKSNAHAFKMFGYVTEIESKPCNPVIDSETCSDLLKQEDMNSDVLHFLFLTFIVVYHPQNIDEHLLVNINVLCSVQCSLKQNDALLFVKDSKLNILNPTTDGLKSISLTRQSLSKKDINEYVKKTLNNIVSPPFVPITIIKTHVKTSCSKFIPRLLQALKKDYSKIKVLLCVRTADALGRIAASLSSHEDFKLVIHNKRHDTNSRFHKYLLDNPANTKVKEPKGTEEETKLKEDLLLNSDVILSLIKNSHDDFLAKTLENIVDKMCCIIEEANNCTEPEILIPFSHKINKLILIGSTDNKPKVLSETACAFNFNQSFFQRAYKLDLQANQSR